MKKIAIVGGGAGGMIAANTLAQKLSSEMRNGSVSITIFDGSGVSEFQPGYLGVAFRGKQPGSIQKPFHSLTAQGIRHVQENCSKVDIAGRTIETEKSKEKYDFDTVIIASGCQPDRDQIPGLAEANNDFHTNAERSAELYRKISEFKGGRIVVGIAGLPYKCPPSPNESAFLLDEFFTRRGIRDKVKITFITPFLRAYSAQPINDVIEPLLEQRNVEITTGYNLDFVDPERKELISLEGEKIGYDTLILVPPHKSADFLKGADYADEDGWAIADKRNLHLKDYDDAFAIGDTTNIPISKAGVEAHLEAITVASNIANDVQDVGERYRFTGRLQCSMETAYHQATFVIGTYEKPIQKIKPSTFNFLEKKAMEKIYWPSLKGGFEWLFKHHFGEDYYQKISS